LISLVAGGWVFTQTNDATDNHLVVLSYDHHGLLSSVQSISTGGQGTGAALGSQGSVAYNNDWVFVVNAGSNDISTFSVNSNGANFVSKVSSGGSTPVSLTIYRQWLYVLNAGGNGNIYGFNIMSNGHLSPISQSSRWLSSQSSGLGAAEVKFSNDGGLLVVTEKNSNIIDTYVVVASGTTSAPWPQSSVGSVPYGFDFDSNNHFIVTDAASNALTSYSTTDSGDIWANNGGNFVPDGQVAPCWAKVSGSRVYTTNAGSQTISCYNIATNGDLSLTGVVASSVGTHPSDFDFGNNDKFLFVLSGSSVYAYMVDRDDGSLTWTSTLNLSVAGVGLAGDR